MSLVKCKECGQKISTSAEVCPNCGAKPPQKTSPTTWIVGILMGLIFWFSYSEEGYINDDKSDIFNSPQNIHIDKSPLDLSRSDDYKKYSNEFKIAAKKIYSLLRCSKNDISSEGFLRSQTYDTYFISCTDYFKKFGTTPVYHLDVKTGEIYLKKNGRLAKINF